MVGLLLSFLMYFSASAAIGHPTSVFVDPRVDDFPNSYLQAEDLASTTEFCRARGYDGGQVVQTLMVESGDFVRFENGQWVARFGSNFRGTRLLQCEIGIFGQPRISAYPDAMLRADHQPSLDRFCVEHKYKHGTVANSIDFVNSAYVFWNATAWERRDVQDFVGVLELSCDY